MFGQQGDSYLDRMEMTSIGNVGDFRKTTHCSPKWIPGSHQFGLPVKHYSRKRLARTPSPVPPGEMLPLEWQMQAKPYKRAGSFPNPFHQPRFSDNKRKHYTRQVPVHMHVLCSEPSTTGADPYFMETLQAVGHSWHHTTRHLVQSEAERVFPPVPMGGGGRTWSVFS